MQPNYINNKIKIIMHIRAVLLSRVCNYNSKIKDCDQNIFQIILRESTPRHIFFHLNAAILSLLLLLAIILSLLECFF